MLTPAQLVLLAADITANSGEFGSLTHDSSGAWEIAAAYNLPASPEFVVWKMNTATGDVFDAIVWANLTPADAPDGNTLWTNRNLQCQSKQLNLQTMLVGRDYLPTGKASVRAGLQDALTSIPSGASGATQAAGWTAVRTAIQRPALRIEKILSSGAGTSGSPGTLTFEGTINYDEVKTAMGW